MPRRIGSGRDGVLHGYRGPDRRVALVASQLEILIAILVQRRRPAPNDKFGQRIGRTRELRFDLLQVIEIQVTIPADPYEVADVEVGLLRDQVRQQRVGRDVERHTEENVRAALVELAGQLPGGDIELEQRVAWG